MSKIAFILPCFNEEEVIRLFHDELLKSIDGLKDDYRFIYVNDGSSDRTAEIITELRSNDDRITLINFSKNFGHEIALTAGLDFAHSINVDAVVLMDTDLQDPPEVAIAMIEKWREGVDVVYGQRRKRHKESVLSRGFALSFYYVLAKLSETDIPPNTSDFRVFDKRVLDEVVKYRERDRFLRGIVSDVGFNQEAYLFDRADRAAGKTHYSFGKLFDLAKTAIFGFSTLPLKVITRLGALVSLLSVLYGFFAIGQKIMDPDMVLPGQTFVIVAMLFLGGLQMVMLGVIGHYIGRTYTEVLNRPLYSIESISASREDDVDDSSRGF